MMDLDDNESNDGGNMNFNEFNNQIVKSEMEENRVKGNKGNQ